MSRGNLPLTYKRLPNDVHALVAVIDPEDPAVAERLWARALADRSLEPVRRHPCRQREAAQRLYEAVPCLEQLITHLGLFRAVKSGLTKSTGEIGKVCDNVERFGRSPQE